MSSEERVRRKRKTIMSALLFCLGMVVAGKLDLLVNRILYSPDNPVAIAFECFGYYPLYLVPILWALLLACDKTVAPLPRVAAGAGAALGAAGLLFYSATGLGERQVEPAAVICLGVWVLLGTNFIKLLRVEAGVLRRLRFALGWGVLYAAANTALVNVLKLIWQRTRFDDLLQASDFSGFTAWYQIPGNGGSSFPSGHTAAACGIFVLVLLCDVLPAWKRYRSLLWNGCWIYIGAMAICRVTIGRHYLSDTLMAAFVMVLLFIFLQRLPIYRNGVKAVCGATAPSTELDEVKPQDEDGPQDTDSPEKKTEE